MGNRRILIVVGLLLVSMLIVVGLLLLSYANSNGILLETGTAQPLATLFVPPELGP